MRVTVVQMSPGTDKAANIDQARHLIGSAVTEDQPTLVALPEVWSCLGGDAATKRESAEELPPATGNIPGGPAYEFLRETARAHRIHVHGGSILEREGDRLYNTTVAFDPAGREVARYRKIHLFDITTPDGTGYRESASFGAGTEISVYEAADTRVGCAICYDIRFAELFLTLRRRGAELIMLPAAFTQATGRDHWEPLLRARAIETQCWFAAPATWGAHQESSGGVRWTYGHSMVVDPWGQVVAAVPDGTGFATAKIDVSRAERVRRDMPVLEHRRLA